MNELQIMTFKGVRGYVDADGVAQLNLEDVARGLGFTEWKNGKEYVMWRRVDRYLEPSAEVPKDDNGVSATSGRRPEYISEPIFYLLSMKAENETARGFQHTIAYDVLPSIRKHGAYMTPDTLDRMIASPDFGIKVLSALKDEREKRKALEAENEAQKQIIADFQPIKQYVDSILSSTRTLTTTQIAADYDMSAKKLNRILHDEGIQRCVNGQWILYQKYMGKGYTKSKTINITRSDGRPDTVLNTEWTQKGRLMIHEILARHGIQASMDKEIA